MIAFPYNQLLEIKKRGNLYLLPVPQKEALAYAHQSKTSNAEAHAVWKYSNSMPFSLQPYGILA